MTSRVRFGVTATATDPPDRFRALVGLIEAAGFDELWVCDSDPMVEAFTVAGPAELWVRRIKEVLALGVTHVNIFLLSGDKHAMVRELAERVLPHVASA